MSLFPVCCYTCRKVINPYYEPFRRKVRAIQSEAAAGRKAGERCDAGRKAGERCDAGRGASDAGSAAGSAAGATPSAVRPKAERREAAMALRVTPSEAKGSESEAAAGTPSLRSGSLQSPAEPLSEEQQKDMVAGALSSLGIHNLCCRIIFLSFVDAEMDELANRGEHLGEGIFAKTAGELSGTVRVIRAPTGGRRLKPSVLLAR